MIRAFEYLTNLAVRCPLPREEGSRLLKIRECRKSKSAGLEIGWQVNLKMFGLNSLIPSPRGRGLGRGLGRGQTSRRLASLAKNTTLSTQ